MAEKKLRFAALIRVSTEKQERQGESLRTQTTQIEASVKALGGKIVARYGGQEHGTAGWERKELDRILVDATKKKRTFDAVVVADASRWSRDNAKSKAGLETFRKAGVRFFSLTSEHDLFDPQAILFLGMSAEIGEYQARTQKHKSLLNRIERAKRGIPTGGKYPFGRSWDKTKERWIVDAEKKAMIEDVAARYLAGEALTDLSREVGMNNANLTKILRERSGTEWKLRFRAADLNLDETVILTIPPLLDERTLKRIRHRLKANRTYVRSGGRAVNDYLLSGRVFCAECGYSMFGQTNHGTRRYYRHAHTERARTCKYTDPTPWVRAGASSCGGIVRHDGKSCPG